MKKFEYQTLAFGGHREMCLDDELNKLGREGWEICYMRADQLENDEIRMMVIAKRELAEGCGPSVCVDCSCGKATK